MRDFRWCMAFILAACSGPSGAVQCEENSNCNLSSGGMCVANPSGGDWCAYPDPACPSGYRYSEQSVGDGVAGTCTMVTDAGVDDVPPDDVPPDMALNCPASAPVQVGQAADLVLGQPGYTSGTANNPNLTGSTMNFPVGVLIYEGRLWISDQGNNRVLQWNSLPAVVGQAASIALGQPNLITASAGVTVDKMGGGGYVARTGTKLLVSDGTNNRVLIWNSVPTASGQPADLVLGQASFTSKDMGNGAANLYGPRGIWSDGTKLIIADRFNNRVLIWNSFPTTNAAPADVVLGASAFDTSPFVMPPTASSLRNPAGVAVTNGKLIVADEGNQRVLIWNSIPSANNAAADIVLGQTGFDTAYNNGGAPYPQVNAIGMVSPNGVAVDECGSLYVCDSSNGRVLVYTTLPTANATPADAVVGKPSFTEQPNAGTPASDAWMKSCQGLSASGTSLFASDQANHRVLRFSLSR